MKGCLKLIFSILAVLILTISILFLVLKPAILNSEIYKAELRKLNVYNLIYTELENQPKGEGIGEIYSFISRNIEIEPIIEKTFENNLDNFLGYLNNNTDEWFIYIPINDLREGFSNDEIKKVMLEGIESQITQGDTCTDTQEQEFAFIYEVETLEDIEALGELDLPDCVPQDKEKFLEVANSVLNEVIDENVSEQNGGSGSLFDSAMQSFGIEDSSSENISASKLFGEDGETTYEGIRNAKNIINTVTIASYIGIVLGLLLLVTNWGISKKRNFKSFIGNVFGPLLSVGIIVTIVGVITRFLPSFIIERLPIRDILTEQAVDFTFDISQVVIEIQRSIAAILNSIFGNILLVGIVITVVSLICLILIRFIKDDKNSTVEEQKSDTKSTT